jgi:hypothetical protein
MSRLQNRYRDILADIVPQFSGERNHFFSFPTGTGTEQRNLSPPIFFALFSLKIPSLTVGKRKKSEKGPKTGA